MNVLKLMLTACLACSFFSPLKQEASSNQIKQEEIKIEDTGISLSDLNQARSSALKREKRVARFYSGLPNSDEGWEYASFFTLDGKVAYCIEPLVLVLLDNAGNGPVYSESIQFQDYDFDTKRFLMRIMWYGYGHPFIGTSDEAWLATQLLIWKTTVPNEYDQIASSLQWCNDKACEVAGNQADVSQTMDQILNLVYNRETAPSFANQDKTCKTYELDWDETLVLTDDGSGNLYSSSPVLDWFNEFPNESHEGINIKKVGNSLYIDIDSLFYEGYDKEKGKTLTFSRKQEATSNALMGNIIWISGSSQRILTASGYDPTDGYSLSFKLKTADLEITKLDEYGINNPLAQGTAFWIGWKEDPLQQYHQDGLADENWKEIHDFNQITFNDENGELYYLLSENNQPKEFVVDESGKLIIKGLLPQNKSWWIKEVKVSNPFQICGMTWEAQTLEESTSNSYSFVNLLRDAQLDLIKQDSESQKRLNDAEFIIYEIADEDQPLDLDRQETILGPLIESTPSLSYKEVLTALEKPEINDSFTHQNIQYTLIEEDDDTWTFRMNDKEEETIPILKPKQIVWEDYINANQPEENESFLCLRENQEYKVLYKEKQKVLVENTSNRQIITLKETEQQYNTEKLIFTPQNKVIDLSESIPILKEKEVELITLDEAQVKIDGNYLLDESIETFLLQIKGKQNYSLDELIQFLKQNSVIQNESDLSIGFQFITPDQKKVTIQNIQFNQDNELESLLLSTPNSLDENKDNLYQVSNQANSYAGLVLDSYRVIISNQNDEQEVKIIEALPFAKVITGKNTLRISDPLNHNLPVSNYPVSIYQSIDGLDLLQEVISDEYGMVNTDSLNPGVYFHTVPNSSVLKEFTVYSKDYLKGEAKITDLKWGRSYLACEIHPTEGYEYEQVCQSFSPKYDLNITNSTLIFNNQLKKIEFNLIKQDEQNHELLLNGAYFSIRKLTSENINTEENTSSLPSKLTYANLPDRFEVNDTFTVEYHQGNKQTYRIQAIEYYDFVHTENDVAFSTIQSVTVFNINDNSKQPIVLTPQSYPTPEYSADEYYPIQVTGSIYFKKTITKPLEKLIWSDLTDILDEADIQKGKSFKLKQKSTVQAPSWNDMQNKGFQIHDHFIVNGVDYTIENITDACFTLSYTNADQQKAQYLVTSNNPVSTVSVLKEVQYTIKEVYKEKDNIIGVVVESKQDEILLYPGQYYTYGEYPQEGVVFEIYEQNNPDSLIQTATTDQNGEIEVSQDAYGNPLNGTYLVKESGSDEFLEFKVEPGKIILSDVDYGTTLEICEIKAPQGYQAKGCQIETIQTNDLNLNYTIRVSNQKKNIEIPKMSEE